MLPVLLNQLTDLVDLFPAQTAAAFQADGIEPHLGAIGIPLNMDMRRLRTVTGEEKAAIRSNAQDGGHTAK